MLADYLGTTYRRRCIVRDLAACRGFLRGRVLDVGGRDESADESTTESNTGQRVVLDKFPRHQSTVQGTAEAIPFPDESFDTVLAVEVFEHLEDPLGAVRECARVLRPGGYLILTVPFMWPVHVDTRAPYWDYTRWTDRQWRAALAAQGLNPKIVRPQGGLGQVILEGVKTLVRNWPKPWRYVGYLAFPVCDALHILDRPRVGPPPAEEVFTSGWLVVASKPGP